MYNKNIFAVEKISGNNLYVILGQKVFVFNELASLIWDSLEHIDNKNNMIDKICSIYDVSFEKAEKDLNDTISFLLKNKLIEK